MRRSVLERWLSFVRVTDGLEVVLECPLYDIDTINLCPLEIAARSFARWIHDFDAVFGPNLSLYKHY